MLLPQEGTHIDAFSSVEFSFDVSSTRLGCQTEE